MDLQDVRTRREFLLAVGAASGCAAPLGSPSAGGDETGTPDGTGTTTSTTGTRARTTEGRTSTTRESPAETTAATTDVGGTWQMDGYDAANTAFNPDAGLESEDVSGAWMVAGAFEEGDILATPAVADGRVYVACGRTVYALDLAGGEEAWTAEAAYRASFMSPAVDDGRVFVADTDFDGGGWLYALDADTGERLWREEWLVTDAPLVADGTLYVRRKDGGSARLLAVDPADGSVEWTFQVPCSPGTTYSYAPPAVVDGVAYLVASCADADAPGSTLFAVDAATGERRWRYDVAHENRWSAPAVSDGAVYFGDIGGFVHAVETGSGEERWTFEAAHRVESSPAVGDGTVYVGCRAETVYALDTADGAKQWEADAPIRYSDPAACGDAVVVGGDYVLGLDPADGSERWRFDLTLHSTEFTSPAVVDGGVVLASCTKQDPTRRYDNNVHLLS